jgi:signal transduction histidine kinase
MGQDDAVDWSTPGRKRTTALVAEEWRSYRRRVLTAVGGIVALLGPIFAVSDFTTQSTAHNLAVGSLLPVGLAAVWLARRDALGVATPVLLLGVLPAVGWVHVFGERGLTAAGYVVPLAVLGMVTSERRHAPWVAAGAGAVAVLLRWMRWEFGSPVSAGSWWASTFDLLVAVGLVGVLVELTLRRLDGNRIILVEALRMGEEATEAARRSSDEKSVFLARVSHELRTPLNAILGYAELLEEEEAVDPESKDDLARIHASGAHLLGLIDTVLDLSKVEAGRLELDVQPASLTAILDEVQATAAPLVARRRNQLLVRRTGPDEAILDVRKIVQVLLNLLSNAARFTADGEIRLMVAAEPDAVVFTVIDTGIGIPADRMHTLFVPFVQVSPSTSTTYGGTGLGLALCDRFVRRMGGHIEVRSEVGEGSRFRVMVPRWRTSPDAGAPPSDALRGPREAT